MSEIFKNSSTFRLFRREPSFAEGASRVIDLGATMQHYNSSSNENEADTKAIQSDWEAVGSDLKSSIKTYEQGAHGTA